MEGVFSLRIYHPNLLPIVPVKKFSSIRFNLQNTKLKYGTCFCFSLGKYPFSVIKSKLSGYSMLNLRPQGITQVISLFAFNTFRGALYANINSSEFFNLQKWK